MAVSQAAEEGWGCVLGAQGARRMAALGSTGPAHNAVTSRSHCVLRGKMGVLVACALTPADPVYGY